MKFFNNYVNDLKYFFYNMEFNPKDFIGKFVKIKETRSGDIEFRGPYYISSAFRIVNLSTEIAEYDQVESIFGIVIKDLVSTGDHIFLVFPYNALSFGICAECMDSLSSRYCDLFFTNGELENNDLIMTDIGNIVNFIKSYHKFVIRVAYKLKLDGKFIKYPKYKKVMKELLDIYLNPGKYIYGLER